MGKKDAMHQMAPVDQYRHQIGRQESKKLLKNETKQRRRKESDRVQKSGAIGYGGMIIFLFLLGLAALYLAAYAIAQNDGNTFESMPFLKSIVDYIGKSYQLWIQPYVPFKK